MGSFEYDAASDTFSPATEAAAPPQRDAKCGFAYHSLVKNQITFSPSMVTGKAA
jgi:hypothetical protein